MLNVPKVKVDNHSSGLQNKLTSITKNLPVYCTKQLSEQDVPLNLFSFHVSSNWKIAGCIYEALDCIKTMADCIGMYLNKNLRKKIVPRERREWQGRSLLGEEIFVYRIKNTLCRRCFNSINTGRLHRNGYIDVAEKWS